MEKFDILSDKLDHPMDIAKHYCINICLPNKPTEWRCTYFLGEPSCDDVKFYVEDFYKLKK